MIVSSKERDTVTSVLEALTLGVREGPGGRAGSSWLRAANTQGPGGTRCSDGTWDTAGPGEAGSLLCFSVGAAPLVKMEESSQQTTGTRPEMTLK